MPRQTTALGIYQHYLDNYAEAESQYALENINVITFDHVVAVPAYNEDIAFLKRLKVHCENETNVLAILIINEPDGPETKQVAQCQLNSELFDYGLNSGKLHWQNKNLSHIRWKNNCHLILIDRFSEERKIPYKQGVGLARKIACDVGVALIAKNNSQQSKRTNVIHSTDADAALPADYFKRTLDVESHSAATFPFVHRGECDEISAATYLYEQSLHYYVNGLRWAGSPYAFHTIGSCLAFSATHYCQVRGFPKRSGGEDFYLLNKLAKLAPIKLLDGEAIILASRNSNRVPFGTGPAVGKILKLKRQSEFQSYDPIVFKELATLLKQFKQYWNLRKSPSHWLAQLTLPSRNTLSNLGIHRLFEHIDNNVTSESHCRQQIQFWFDGFRTLKYIHELQNNFYPSITLSEALRRARFLLEDGENEA